MKRLVNLMSWIFDRREWKAARARQKFENWSDIVANVQIWYRFISIKELIRIFPLFHPMSGGGGPRIRRAWLTIQTINQTFPFLSSFATTLSGKKLPVERMEDFAKTAADRAAATEIKTLFDLHKSNKANVQAYHHFYGVILKDKDKIENILEIGLGTNNLDVISNMGADASPGSSLRAFRAFCVNANIYGADVDKRILFSEDRIKTFYIDQTDTRTFDDLAPLLPDAFDLMIDDGLHSPHANIETLRFFVTKVKVGGWAVIEDIAEAAIPLWEVVAALLGDAYESHILLDHNNIVVFAAKRLR